MDIYFNRDIDVQINGVDKDAQGSADDLGRTDAQDVGCADLRHLLLFWISGSSIKSPTVIISS